jgi:hypothetical protein
LTKGKRAPPGGSPGAVMTSRLRALPPSPATWSRCRRRGSPAPCQESPGARSGPMTGDSATGIRTADSAGRAGSTAPPRSSPCHRSPWDRFSYSDARLGFRFQASEVTLSDQQRLVTQGFDARTRGLPAPP